MSLGKWLVSLGGKFFKVAPWITITIAFTNLISQVSLILATLLPIKVVMLLGIDGIPTLLDMFSENKTELILLLSGASILFYVSHFCASKTAMFFTERACTLLLKKSAKMTLFENQEELAISGYQRFSRVFAGSLFIIIALLVLLYIYFDLGLVVFVYLLSLAVVYHFFVIKNNRYEVVKPSIYGAGGNIGFFVAFAFLVLDFLFLNPPDFSIAIISILVSRQLFLRFSSLFTDLISLFSQRYSLDVIFFHNKTVYVKESSSTENFWSLARTDNRKLWLQSLLGKESSLVSIELISVGVSNILGFLIPSAQEYKKLVKIYGAGRRSYASNEITLLSGKVPGLPAPLLIDIGQLGEFEYSISVLPSGRPATSGDINAYIDELLKKVTLCIPSKSLVEQYKRSKRLLWQRMDKDFESRLYVCVSNVKEKELIDLFFSYLPDIRNILKKLPLVIVVPEFTKESLWISKDWKPILINWTQWGLEPLGAGLADKESVLEAIAGQFYEDHSSLWSSFQCVYREIKIAALIYALEEKLNKQRFRDALLIVEVLNQVYTGLDVSLIKYWGKGFLNSQDLYFRESYLSNVLKETIGLEVKSSFVEWWQSYISDISIFSVNFKKDELSFLIKSYSPNRAVVSRTEHALAASAQINCLPALSGASKSGVFDCLVFSLEGNVRDISSKEYLGALSSVLLTLVAFDPEIIRFSRSYKKSLWDRLAEESLLRLNIGANTDLEKSIVKELIGILPKIQDLLKKNPSSLIVPEILPKSILAVDKYDGGFNYILTSWSDWTIEPAGAGWGVSEKHLTCIKKEFHRAVTCRPILGEIPFSNLELAAYCYYLDSKILAGRFSDALKVVPLILKCWKEAGEQF